MSICVDNKTQTRMFHLVYYMIRLDVTVNSSTNIFRCIDQESNRRIILTAIQQYVLLIGAIFYDSNTVYNIDWTFSVLLYSKLQIRTGEYNYRI